MEKFTIMTLKEAWDIAGDFGEFLEHGRYNALYEFEDVLPHKKSAILIALLKILKEENFRQMAALSGQNEKAIKENIAANIVILFGFIPSPESYKDMLRLKEEISKDADALIKL